MDEDTKIYLSEGKIYKNHKELTGPEFYKLFPIIGQKDSGELVFINNDKSISIPLETLDFDFLSNLNISENTIARFQNYGKNQNNDLFNLVKAQGLEKEHCIIFMNKVMFHSTCKEKADAYERENSSIAFTRYGPIT